MKFNVPGKALQQQISAVSKVINAKNALSILDNFLLEVKGDVLYITGSDQETVMTAKVEISNLENDGRIAVNAKRLMDVVKEVSNFPLTFEVDDNQGNIDLQFPGGHFEFMGVDAAEYPQGFDTDELTVEMTVPAQVILKGLDYTLFAISTETIRPMMTGVYWDFHENDITFVGSDTHKLVRYINSEYHPNRETSFILPGKPAGILRSLIGKDTENVSIQKDEKSAIFTFGDFRLGCRFVKGMYPNYNRVIPTDNPNELTIDRQALLAAMRRVSLFASKASSLVKMTMDANTLRLDSQDLDYSTKANETVTCSYEGNPISIGFNAVYMVEVLNNLPGDNIVVKLSDPGRPGLFMPFEQKENEEVLMLQMPMQVIE
ncbi:MAG: DNA polymerase III subunit beta [Muribaculaceae bacterium]|nr:DNA polymerase III subunit beta [Muribaculaceae bacterium]